MTFRHDDDCAFSPRVFTLKVTGTTTFTLPVPSVGRTVEVRFDHANITTPLGHITKVSSR